MKNDSENVGLPRLVDSVTVLSHKDCVQCIDET
jgi:hypothetical protein